MAKIQQVANKMAERRKAEAERAEAEARAKAAAEAALAAKTETAVEEMLERANSLEGFSRKLSSLQALISEPLAMIAIASMKGDDISFEKANAMAGHLKDIENLLSPVIDAVENLVEKVMDEDDGEDGDEEGFDDDGLDDGGEDDQQAAAAQFVIDMIHSMSKDPNAFVIKG